MRFRIEFGPAFRPQRQVIRSDPFPAGGLEVGDEVGLAVLEAKFAADVLAVSSDGGFGDAAELGDFLGGEAIADHGGDSDFDGGEFEVFAGELGEEGGGDFLEALSEEGDVGAFAAGDSEFELEDDGHDDLLDIGEHRGADLVFLFFESGEDGAEGDVAFLECLVLVAEDFVGIAEVGFDLEVHQGAADAFGDDADEGIFLSEKGSFGEDGDAGSIEDFDSAFGFAIDADFGGHAPAAFLEFFAEVLALAMGDTSAGVFGELPSAGEVVDDALEEVIDGMEVEFAEAGDGVEALEFFDAFPKSEFDFGEGARGVGG